MLRSVGDLREADVADALGVTEGVVSSALVASRRSLAQQLPREVTEP